MWDGRSKRLSTDAILWKVERKDGVTHGFTSHDQPLNVGGFTYYPNPAIDATSIGKSAGLEASSAELSAFIDSSAFSENDMEAGRWFGAKISIYRCSWMCLDKKLKHIFTGFFGDINRNNNQFTVDIVGMESRLKQNVVPSTSPTCRAQFGDKACGVSLHRYRREVTLDKVERGGLVFEELNGDAGKYIFGNIRWLSGERTGIIETIAQAQGNILYSADAPFTPVYIGNRALLTQGCNKQFSVCVSRFSNAINFRGEPHLPGNDLLTRYPGG